MPFEVLEHRNGLYLLILSAALGAALFAPETSAAPTVDFNADGYADVVVGAPGEDIGAHEDAGAINVFFGSPSGIAGTTQIWHLDSPGIALGAAAGDRFGSAWAAGDFNGDAYSDLAVGAPYRNGTKGEVLVLYGSSTGLTAAGWQRWDQDALEDAPEFDDRFGSALVAGDFDSDGIDDLAIGVPGEDFPDVGPPDTLVPMCGTCTNAGIVNLIYGSSSGLSALHNELWHQDRGTNTYDGFVEWQDCFGNSLAVGDFNGNGTDDLAVGAACESTGGATAAELFNGAVSVYLGTPGIGLTGDGAQYLRQWSAASAGTPQKYDAFGYSIAAGDFDDDGFDDLAIGVPGEETDVPGGPETGALMVYYGAAADGLNPDASQRNEIWSRNTIGLPADALRGRWGWSMAAGDFNHDGIDDVATGSPMDDANGVSDAGSVTVMYGTPTRLKATGNVLVHQDSPGMQDSAENGDWFGASLQTGDYDGDGFTDLGIGVPFENVTNVRNAGALQIVYGDSLREPAQRDDLLFQDSLGSLDSPEQGDGFGGRLEPVLYGNPWEISPLVDEAGVPGLFGSISAAPAIVNLTTEGPSDWIDWGRRSLATSVDRKINVTPQITSFTVLGGGTPLSGASCSAGYGWSDGTPTASVSSAARGVRVENLVGGGFSFSVPADARARTLKVFFGASRARARLVATLSDDPANPYTAVVDRPTSKGSHVAVIRYQATSAGQQLAVSVTTDALYSGTARWVSLESAALEVIEAPPESVVTPTIGPNGGSYVGSTQVSLSTTTLEATIYYTIDGFAPGTGSLQYAGPFVLSDSATVKAVAVKANGATSGVGSATFIVTPQPLPIVETPTASPNGGVFLDPVTVSLGSATTDAVIYYSTNGSTPSSSAMLYTGPFSLTQSAVVKAIAIKSGMQNSAVSAANFTIGVLPGSLSGSSFALPSTVNLTNAGTADWIHWGRTSNNSYVVRKAGVPAQISSWTPKSGTTTNPIASAGNGTAYTWTDGTPEVASTGSQRALRMFNVGNGLTITAPADTSIRTLELYLGAQDAQGKLDVTLSDGSAAPYTVLVDAPSSKVRRVVVLTYAANSANQTLQVDYSVQTRYSDPNFSSKWVNLEGAALKAVAPPPPPLPLQNLVVNPSFEQIGTRWTMPVHGSYSSTYAYTGAMSAQFEHLGSVPKAEIQERKIPNLVVGKEYVVSVRYRGDAVVGTDNYSGNAPLLFARFRDANDATMTYINESGTKIWREGFQWAPLGTQPWTELKMYMQFPVGATYLDLGARHWYDTTAGKGVISGTSYWDDFVITPRVVAGRGALLAAYEAEQAAWMSNGIIDDDDLDYRGTGYFDVTLNPGTLIWNNVQGGGSRVIAVRYAWEGGPRPVELFVNGVSQGKKTPITTGRRGVWATENWGPVNLPAGNNTVKVVVGRLTSAGKGVAPQLDRLEVYEAQ